MVRFIKKVWRNFFGSEDIIEDSLDLDWREPVQIENPTPHDIKRLAQRRMSRTRSLGATMITEPKFLWILDNGHGRLQNGKRSPVFADGSQLMEWKFNRDIVSIIMKELDKRCIQYVNLVPEEEVGSFLRKRVDRANAIKSPYTKVYVSIHGNAMGMGDWYNGATGVETWFCPGSFAGEKIASVFQEELMIGLPGWKDRGIKSHSKGSNKTFYILKNTNMPAILTENGFYSDEEECKKMMSPEYIGRIAMAHVRAIAKIEECGFGEVLTYKPKMTMGG